MSSQRKMGRQPQKAFPRHGHLKTTALPLWVAATYPKEHTGVLLFLLACPFQYPLQVWGSQSPHMLIITLAPSYTVTLANQVLHLKPTLLCQLVKAGAWVKRPREARKKFKKNKTPEAPKTIWAIFTPVGCPAELEVKSLCWRPHMP